MSRPLRIQYDGAWYHVMNRGLNRRRIFHDEEHRCLFLDLLKDIHERYGVQTHAYCLMDNHYHLILHTPKANLSRAMRHLDGIYTQRFNRNLGRDGPLFRGRYKAILMEAEHYLLQLSRYIHLNPVSAKLCSQPEQYVWSSYKAYLKQVKRPDWLYCDEVLGHCSEKMFIKEYQKFVKEGIDENILKIFSKTKLPNVLGCKEWIEEIKTEYLAEKVIDDEMPEIKDLMLDSQPENIFILMKNVADFYKVPLDGLKQRGHRHAENMPRNMLIYLALSCGYENKVVAEVIGKISGAGVSKIRRRMDERLENNKILRKEFEKIRSVFV